MIGVYTITHRFTQRFYVGHSKNVLARFRSHRNQLRRNAHHCIHLQRAWNLDGEGAFDFRCIAEFGTVAEAISEEQVLLDAFFADGLLYNSCATNDPAGYTAHLHTLEAHAKCARAKSESPVFQAALAANRLLARTSDAQRKRVETTRRNDTWCAAQRKPVYSIRIEDGLVENFRSLSDAARAHGSSAGNVQASCVGLRRQVAGFTYAYGAL